MNFNPIICELCKKVIEIPIVLPCGDTICSYHASEIEFSCPFCQESHQKPPKGYPENKKLKILTDKFEKARTILNKLHSNVLVIKTFKENGEDILNEEFSKIKEQINTKKELTKILMNDLIEANYVELIAEVDLHQKVLRKILAGKESIDQIELNKIESEILKWKADLSAIKISENIWEEIEKQYSNTSEKLESFKSNLNIGVDKFIQEKMCVFKEKNIKIDKIVLGEVISTNLNEMNESEFNEEPELLKKDNEKEEEKYEHQNEDMPLNDFLKNFEKQLRTKGHLKPINSIKFDRSEKFIITGADNIKIWRACDGLLVCMLKGPRNVQDFDISYENNVLVAVYADSNLFVFNLNAPELISIQNAPFDNYSVKFSPMVCKNNYRWIVSTSNKNSICFWKMNSETFEFSSYPIKFIEKNSDSSYINRVSFSRGGVFAAVSYEDKRIDIFYINDVNVIKISELTDLKAKISSIQFANNSLKFISCFKDSTTSLWTYSSKKWSPILIKINEQSKMGENSNEDVDNISKWTCDDKKVITAINNSSLYSINVWDVVNNITIHKLENHRDKIIGLEPNPKDPNILLSFSKNHLYVWNLFEGVAIHRFVNLLGMNKGVPGFSTVCWSPSGESFTSGDLKGGLTIFSKENHEAFKRFSEQFFINDFCNKKLNFNKIDEHLNMMIVNHISKENLIDEAQNIIQIKDSNPNNLNEFCLKIHALTSDALTTFVSMKFSHRLEEKLIYDKEFKKEKREDVVNKENFEIKKPTKRPLKSDIGIKNRNLNDDNLNENLNGSKKIKKFSLDDLKTKTPPKNSTKQASKSETHKSAKVDMSQKKRSSDDNLIDLDI